VLTLLCAYISEIPISLVASFEGDNLKIEWTLPSDNGSPITEYKVFVKEIGTE
jgi:hypothetical protein